MVGVKEKSCLFALRHLSPTVNPLNDKSSWLSMVLPKSHKDMQSIPFKLSEKAVKSELLHGGASKIRPKKPIYIYIYTPPKFKMEPENDGFQKESPFPGTSFQVPC